MSTPITRFNYEDDNVDLLLLLYAVWMFDVPFEHIRELSNLHQCKADGNLLWIMLARGWMTMTCT